MLRKGILICVLLIAFAGLYYFQFSQAAQYRRAAQHELDGVAATINKQDAALAKSYLEGLIAQDAAIKLRVFFGARTQTKNTPEAEPMGKADFIGFIDNVLYSLKAVSFKASTGFPAVDSARKLAEMDFSVEGSGRDTMSALGMPVEFTLSGGCHAVADINTEKMQIRQLDCDVTVGKK